MNVQDMRCQVWFNDLSKGHKYKEFSTNTNFMTNFSSNEATITRPMAKALGVDYALANRLMGVYNRFLYIPGASRIKVGNRQSQMLLGSSYPKLNHLANFQGNSKYDEPIACLLAAAGYVKASRCCEITAHLLEAKIVPAHEED